MFACNILIDLQKAFDLVYHNILLHKLNHYEIRDLSHHYKAFFQEDLNTHT